MIKISKFIDKMNIWIGKFAAWFILASIFVSAANAITRFFFNKASNSALDFQSWGFSVGFLFCAAWTLMLNEHIRIDIVNQRLKNRTRYWIDIFGHSCVLIPFCVMVIYMSFPWALKSVMINEQSFNASGLPQWIFKVLIPMAFSLLLLQAISELIKRVAVLRGKIEEPYGSLDSHVETEMILPHET